MAVQIYNQAFYVGKKSYETKADARNKALEEANEFFFNKDSVDIVNIIEEWSMNFDFLSLVIYYKGYI